MVLATPCSISMMTQWNGICTCSKCPDYYYKGCTKGHKGVIKVIIISIVVLNLVVSQTLAWCGCRPDTHLQPIWSLLQYWLRFPRNNKYRRRAGKPAFWSLEEQKRGDTKKQAWCPFYLWWTVDQPKSLSVATYIHPPISDIQ